ncbi:MAG TPA: carbohydrate kinase family protein [Patescibacteria group bacterium]
MFFKSRKKTSVLAIGSVTKDIFLPTNEGIIVETPEDLLSQRKISFELGAKYHIKDRHETSGGCSINVGVGLAKLGETVECYSPIGDDLTGRWIKEELEKCSIDTKHLVTEEGLLSDESSIIVDVNSGERTIFSSHNASEKFQIQNDRIGNPQWIFIGDLSGDWRNNLDIIIEAAKKKNISLAFNPRQKTIHDDAKKIIETISNVELLFVNKDEAIEIVSVVNGIEKSELNDEKYLVEQLEKMGAKIVVLTDGTRGAWGFDGKEFLHADALLREAVDTTGAGDAFTSGFFAAHIKGKELSECLKWGIANSSSSVMQYGGQKGLLGEDEIVEFASRVAIEVLL